jgi:hypothetical protein
MAVGARPHWPGFKPDWANEAGKRRKALIWQIEYK